MAKPAEDDDLKGGKPGEGDGEDPVDWEAKYREAIKHSRTWEERAKANQGAADRLKELEDASKTELQKALDAQKAAEDELAALKKGAELDKARAKVAAETGVPAEFVVGDDEGAMREYAERLAEHYKTPPAPSVPQAGKFAREPKGDPADEAKRELARKIFGNDE